MRIEKKFLFCELIFFMEISGEFIPFGLTGIN